MKPFDLEAALAGKPVVTRDGREVTQIHKFDVFEDYPLHGVVDGSVQSYAVDGKWSKEIDMDDEDLFMNSESKTVWVNLYAFGGCAHTTTEQEANRLALPNRIGGKAFPITYEV